MIKVKVTEGLSEKIYPYLGVSAEGAIVYFVGVGQGLLIRSAGMGSGGGVVFRYDWVEGYFSKLDGSVELSNG